MSLLSIFERLIKADISVYALGASVSSWGTAEKDYGVARTISGYIQPIGGNEAFANQRDGIASTHRLYIYATESVNDSDKIIHDGVTYYVTYNPKNGVSGINDHREIGLRQHGS